MSTSTFADRLKELMNYYRLNKNSLSVRLGFTANTSITRLANHPERFPSFEILCLILKAFPEISSRWLILGDGEMLISDEIIRRQLWTRYYMPSGITFPLTSKKTEPTDWIRVHGYSECEIAVDVFGDSMAPRINSGDIVLCKEVINGDSIAFGEAHFIASSLEPMVRYIKSSPSEGVLKLGAENPRFEDFEMKKADVIAMYRVKGLIRREAL